MSPHLSAVLREFADDQGRAAAVRAPDTDLEARLIVSRVRRRKLTRVSTVAASVVAVLALGVVTVYGATRPGPVPPATPDPVPTLTPSPTPSLSPSPSAPAQVDTGVTVHPLLPEALPLEPGILSAAPPASSLVVFQASCGYPCPHPTSPEVLYLVTPDGQYFEARIAGLDSMELTDWLPGSPRALFTRWGDAADPDGEFYAEYLVLDLESGDVVGGPFRVDEVTYAAQAWLGTADDVYLVVPPAEWGERSELRRVSYSGDVLASTPIARQPELTWNADRSLVLENGSSGPVVFRATSLEAVALTPLLSGFEMGVTVCDGIGWFSTTELLLDCHEQYPPEFPDDGNMAYGWTDGFMWVVAPDGAATRLGFYEAEQSMPLWQTWRLGDRVVGVNRWSGSGVRADSGFVEVTRSGSFTPLGLDAESLTIHGSVRDGVVASVWSPQGASSLQLIDPFTGTSSVLLGSGDEGYVPRMQVVTYSDPG